MKNIHTSHSSSTVRAQLSKVNALLEMNFALSFNFCTLGPVGYSNHVTIAHLP